MCRAIWWTTGLVAGMILAGCGSGPKDSGTGAEECVRAYFEALVQNHLPRAYANLDPQTRKRFTLQQFTQLVQQYRSNLGFDPDTVYVRSCEERGHDATAHVVLAGRSASQDHRYKDAVALRRGDDGWRVVLPPNFGRAKKR